MGEEESAEGLASNFIWAIALIIIVMLIVGGLYYGDSWRGVSSGRR